MAPPTHSLSDETGIVELPLRQEQSEAIDALRRGQDVLVVLPTGSGKSRIYQVAGTLMEGPTVVVTPLLALQADQMRSIQSSGLPAPVAVDGSTSQAERRRVVATLANGEVEFLFCTPEILANGSFVDELAELGVGLFVVDEAHCIVTWGGGFRPDYLSLGDVRAKFGHPPALALTASADPGLRNQIASLLHMDEPHFIVGNLERSNIHLELEVSPDRARSKQHVLARAAASPGKVLLYLPTRALCEEMAQALDHPDRSAYAFHGGMKMLERDAVLEAAGGTKPVAVCATNAFGMGIDIPDIRTVLHLDLPESLIAYYQEVGRAGRDGDPANAVGFVSARSASRRAFAGGSRPVELSHCVNLWQAIDQGVSSKAELARTLGIPAGVVSKACFVLERAGALSTYPSVALTGAAPDLAEVETICGLINDADRSQTEAVRRYRSARYCRWSQLLASLGEAAGPCRHCDVCESDDSDEGPMELVGAGVEHAHYGPGVVTAIEGPDVSVAFESVGPKTLDLKLCLHEELLVIDLRDIS